MICIQCERGPRIGIGDHAREVPMTEIEGHPVHLFCQHQVEHSLKSLRDGTVRDADGLMRWDSNGSIPPEDCFALWVRMGLVSHEEADRHVAVRDTETQAFLQRYRDNWKPPTGEALSEMRNAFGEGTEVVDVVAGRRFMV